MLARCRSPWQWRTWPARRRCSSRSRRLASSSRQRAVRRAASLGPEDRLGQRREILGVALDHLAHSGVAAVFAAHRRLRVERRDLRRQVVHDRGRELAARGDAIEPRLLIEPRHLEQPFDRLPRSGQGQPIAIGAGHRHEAPIQHRRGPPVQRELRLERASAPIERGEVEEAVADRALHLVRALADQEHVRGMGGDPLDLGAGQAVAAAVAQVRDHGILRIGRGSRPAALGHRATRRGLNGRRSGDPLTAPGARRRACGRARARPPRDRGARRCSRPCPGPWR